MNQLRIATYNLRYANDKDTGNLWVDRSPVVINLIRFHDFDILGTQEGIKLQLDDISTSLHYYQRFGVARDDGKEAGEHSAIFFKTEKFGLIKGGNFWLSEKPQSPGLGWDAKHKRLCTWVELEIKDNQEKIFVFNAHFDYHGIKAREESSRLVLEMIAEIAAGNKCVLIGDFNSDHETICYKTLAGSQILKDAFALAEHPYINNPSFNSWGKDSEENKLIDHIFVTRHFKVNKYGILTDTYFSKVPSDHFPVVVDLTTEQ